ncbi:MAG: aminotransferase, partial [Proteobacteria bacterium]|nr:aminotransferase [Pseudomonadota bacterium]
VCSTTLPQQAIPRILQHPEYPAYLAGRRRRYERLSQIAYHKFREVSGLLVNRTNGAFYTSVVFEEGRLNHSQVLPISNPEVLTLVEGLTSSPDIHPDKRFVYYLLASTGICVVPLSSFNTALQGFRMTLLEPDETLFCRMIDTLVSSIESYIESSQTEAFQSAAGFRHLQRLG